MGEITGKDKDEMARTPHSTATKPTLGASAHPGFWMRSVQFAGLHRILHRLAEHPEGIRAVELDRLVVENGDYRVADGARPSKTTLYHCRTTLLNLGAAVRRAQRWSAAFDDPYVAQLLDVPPVWEGSQLPRSACDAFSSLALANADCYRNFFRLFISQNPVSAEGFRRTASSAVWRSLIDEGPNNYELFGESIGTRIRLTAPIQIQSILYGVRDWACKQLGLLGEFHEIGRGSVLFPLRHPDCVDATAAVRKAMLAVIPDSAEWTMVSVADLLYRVCDVEGYSVAALHRGIDAFVHSHPGYVGLIATIPNWATVTATTRKQGDFHLEAAHRDSAGRIISHIRFHHCIREQQNGKENGKERRAAIG
jgi:hypothetical protein